MITLKNKKGDTYCKLDKDGITYVYVEDESLSVSFRIIKGDRQYIETFKERIIEVLNEIPESEFEEIFDKTINQITKLKNELTS